MGRFAHTLRAVATDNFGLTSTSAAVFVNVVAAPIVTNLTLKPRATVSGDTTTKAWTSARRGRTPPTPTRHGATAWPTLGFGNDGEVTTVRGQPRITYYFRRQFLVPAGFTGTNLVVKLSRDDGAIVHLNGREIVRDNMPVGAVGYSTRPNGAVSSPNEQAYFTFITNAAALRVGTNVIAVEVHQIDGLSTDLGFNLELASSRLADGREQSGAGAEPGGSRARAVAHLLPEANGLTYVVERLDESAAWFPVATNTVSGGVFHFVTGSTNPPAQFFRVRRLP